MIQSLVNPQKRAVLPATLARFYRVKKTWLHSIDDRHRNKQYSSKTLYSNPLQITKNQQRLTQKGIYLHNKQGRYIYIYIQKVIQYTNEMKVNMR